MEAYCGFKTNSLAFSYLCENDFMSERVADILGLNFFVFGYLIPSELMFSNEYWEWRLNNPSESEIYRRHLDLFYKTFGVEKDIIENLQGKERFKYLLKNRGCDKQLINELLNGETINDINWDVVLSQFDVVTSKGTKSYWRIDTSDSDGILTSELFVDEEDVSFVKFYPLFDMAGFVKINGVRINGKEFNLECCNNSFRYMPKNTGCFSFAIDNCTGRPLEVSVRWEYKRINDLLAQNY